MPIDISSDFFAVDELIQVIYQGNLKFVVIFKVTRTAWNIHVALDKTERWWAGQWTPGDVDDFLGHKASSEDAEALADSLAELITKGELHVGNWSDEQGAKINLTLGPTAKRPVRIPLTELEPVEAAKFATSIFTIIAVNAKDYKCRICPAPYDLTSTTGDMDVDVPLKTSAAYAPPSAGPSITSYASSSTTKRKASQSPAESTKPLPAPSSPSKITEDSPKVKKLEKELAEEKRKHRAHHGGPSTSINPDPHVERLIQEEAAKALKKLPRRGPGVSLANPTQKARKYQAVEWEDSD